MKTIDVIAAVVLVLGGLNWGLMGFFEVNLIANLFGDMSAMTRLIYCIFGVAALYEVFQWKSVQKRWARKGK